MLGGLLTEREVVTAVLVCILVYFLLMIIFCIYL